MPTIRIVITPATFYCHGCRDWKKWERWSDDYGSERDEPPKCAHCGDTFACDYCGAEIDWSGSCTREGGCLRLTVTRVAYWYFRDERAWVVQALNAADEQQGESEYVYSGKPDALIVAQKMAARNGDVPVEARGDK